MLKKYFITKKNYILLIFLLNIVFAQESKIKIDTIFNPSDSSYWWLEKNNFGLHSEKVAFLVNWEFQKSNTEYVVNLFNQNSEQKIHFNQTFIKHNFSDKTFLRLGRYYRDFSTYLNDELSSGSMLVSNNARPIDKIGLVTSKQVKRNQNLKFTFGIAHGFFEKENYYPKAPFLHEKFLYLNINKKNYEYGIGFVHEAMWGGTTVESLGAGPQPSTFKDFLKVMLSADGPEDGGEHPNALGNHLGIWDFYVLHRNNDKNLKFYYQHYFEDTSSLRFANKTDGLWGVELENYIHNTNLLFEYLNTSNAYLNPPYQGDRYYWNYQYRLGWRHNGNIIGNPFVNTYRTDNSNNLNFIDLTKLVHLGIDGHYSSFFYKMKASRRINIHDTIRYKIEVGKSINKRIKMSIFSVNNSTGNGLGLSIFSSF